MDDEEYRDPGSLYMGETLIAKLSVTDDPIANKKTWLLSSPDWSHYLITFEEEVVLTPGLTYTLKLEGEDGEVSENVVALSPAWVEFDYRIASGIIKINDEPYIAWYWDSAGKRYNFATIGTSAPEAPFTQASSRLINTFHEQALLRRSAWYLADQNTNSPHRVAH